jgi:threonyl-tRNA synthetase
MTNKEQGSAGEPVVAELNPLPDFIQSRQKLWDKFKAENDSFLASQTSVPISVVLHLPTGEKTVSAESWKSTPYALSREHVTKGFADSIVISKVNGRLWDLSRPLEGDAEVQFLSFEDSEGQQVFWHSTAHMLGEACERVFGGHLCYGPPIENGFYYDMFVEKKEDDAGVVSTAHFKTLESVMQKISKERQPFERLELTKAQLLEMFA